MERRFYKAIILAVGLHGMLLGIPLINTKTSPNVETLKLSIVLSRTPKVESAPSSDDKLELEKDIKQDNRDRVPSKSEYVAPDIPIDTVTVQEFNRLDEVNPDTEQASPEITYSDILATIPTVIADMEQDRIRDDQIPPDLFHPRIRQQLLEAKQARLKHLYQQLDTKPQLADDSEVMWGTDEYSQVWIDGRCWKIPVNPDLDVFVPQPWFRC